MFPFPTRDGRGLIYSANPTSVDLALWWRPFDGTAPTRLTTGVGEYTEASMTPDGQTMVSTLVQFRQSLTAFPMSSGVPSSPRRSPMDRLETWIRRYHPTASAGVQFVAIGLPESLDVPPRRHDGPCAHLGQRVRRAAGVFSRREAACLRLRQGRARGIWTMSADGGIPELLVKADVIDRLVWSADGRRHSVAMTVDDVPTLHIGERRGQGRPSDSDAGPGGQLRSRLSDDTIGYLEPFPGAKDQPNVNRVAFVRTTGEPVPMEGLRSLNLANGFAVISPDGHRLAGVVDPGGAASSIWVAELSKGTPFLKMADLPSDVRLRGATWTSGSDTLIVGTIQRTSRLVLFDQAK